MHLRWLFSAALMLWPGAVLRAQVMHPTASLPAASAVMDATNTRFYVRFDGPVDHAASTLSIFQDGRVVQTLHPRLDSAPNTLFGSGRRLPAGAYELHWMTRPMHGQQPSEGSIPFTVAGGDHG